MSFPNITARMALIPVSRDGSNPHRELWYVSVITLAETQEGIELLNDGHRKSQLKEWLQRDLESWFSGRGFPIDRQAANRWAGLVAKCTREGRLLPTIDSLIAATGLAHNLTIVTRNVPDCYGTSST